MFPVRIGRKISTFSKNVRVCSIIHLIQKQVARTRPKTNGLAGNTQSIVWGCYETRNARRKVLKCFMELLPRIL